MQTTVQVTMPLRAQRPAPPPPGSGTQQKKPNLNTSIRKTSLSDTNNNRQGVVFIRPTVIRPTGTSNKPLKKKPPPRPAPPRNYPTSKTTANNVTTSTPDILADLQNIFSSQPTGSRQSTTTTSSSFSYKTSSNPKPPAAFPFQTSNQTASFQFRPTKKYQAPVPSANKSNSGEVSLIDFDSPVATARVTPSNMVAMAAVANQHKSLLDWNASPQKLSFPLPKSSSFDLLSANNPFAGPAPVTNSRSTYASQNVSSVMTSSMARSSSYDLLSGNSPFANSASGANSRASFPSHNVMPAVKSSAGFVQQRAASFAAQNKDVAVNWSVANVKEQLPKREFSPPEPKFPPPPPPPTTTVTEQAPVIEICGALFDFAAENPDELSLRVGDHIEVEEKQNADWWTGRCNGQRGVFPAAFVQSQCPAKTEKPRDETNSSSDGCFAKAIFTFVAEQPTDLPFQEGDVVQVLYRINQDWLFGSCQGREGQFPAGFVQKINTAAAATSSQSVCRALYSFKAENADELNFREGDRIVITEKSSADWWKGKLEKDSNEREGLFPAAFVETL